MTIDTLDMHRYELVDAIELLTIQNTRMMKRLKLVDRACDEYLAGNYEESADLMMKASSRDINETEI